MMGTRKGNKSMIKLLKEAVEKRYGRMIYARDCQHLSGEIEKATGKQISETTLKRAWGYAKGVKPQLFTLDALSEYAGEKDWASFFFKHGQSSLLGNVISLNSCNLKEGDMIQVSYHPDRNLQLKYEGNNWFSVEKSGKSKLKDGDRIEVYHFIKNEPMVAKSVIRGGENIGDYIAGAGGGITKLQHAPGVSPD